MELLTMAIVLVGVAAVTSKPCCEQMCNNNCTNQMHTKTKIGELHRKREIVTTVTSMADEEVNKAHSPHERMQDKKNKQNESKEDWEELVGHEDDTDHGNQYLAELLTSIDSEMISNQATQMEDDNDRFDEILQF